MLYSILKIMIRITVWVYFRKIHVRNAELIPQDVPLIIVPNHPSSFMDIMVIVPFIKKQFHFILKGEAFNTPFKLWLLSKLNLIPIYRKDKTPELMHKNREVFEKCYQLLANRGSLIIFPEGISKTERRLRKIKSGAARIALGAEALNNFELGVTIVPVGLNYSDPHKFQSELLINIAQPIDVSQFFELYQEHEHKGIVALTEHIKECLEQHTIAIENKELDELVKNIETIYSFKLKRELGLSEKEQEFTLTKEIVEAVHHFHRKRPLHLQAIQQKIQGYMKDMDRLNLKDHLLRKRSTRGPLIFDVLQTLAYITIGFPVYLYGVINNFLAFISPRTDFYGSVAMSTGMATFMIFYSLQIWLVASFTPVEYGWWIPVAYAVSLPITGILSLYYWRYLKKIRGRWLFISLFYRKNSLITKLIKQREDIMKDLSEGKIDYINSLNLTVQ